MELSNQMRISKNVAVNQIADDWLLVYPNTYKAGLVSALNELDEHSIEDIYSFHDRIKSFSTDKKRQVLEELPQAFKAEIEKMLQA